MSNVIEFPKKTPQLSPASLEESLKYVEEVRMDFCDEVSSDILEAVFSVMANYGLKIDTSEKGIKHTVFVEEAIRALVYSTKNLEHPFHKISNEAIVLDSDFEVKAPSADKKAEDVEDEETLLTP